MGEVANIFLLCGWRILVERMRRTLGDCICKHKACESADHSVGLLMVLVRVFYLRGEESFGTKQGMENGFVRGIFPSLIYWWGDSAGETTCIFSVSLGESSRRRGGEACSC